jgi:GPH family glycoside/pentoside/hexuronide:cation symporter
MAKTVPTRTKILYGVADSGLATLVIVTQFYLLFYFTDIAMINAAIAGTALMVGKLTWDAFNDPLFGWLSDRTKSRWGRRRPYMLFGAWLLVPVTWVIFSLPTGLTGALAFFAVLGSFLLFDTILTMVSVPYYSMMPELSQDYDERTTISAIRQLFTIFGAILGAAATTAIVLALESSMHLSETAAYSGMGLIFGLFAAIVIFITAATVKEKKTLEFKPTETPAFKAIRQALHNKPFVRLLLVNLISLFSFALLPAMVPYWITYQLDMEAQISIVMLIMYIAAAASLFPWKWVSERINKGPAYALGLFIASAVLILAFWIPRGPTPLVYVVAVLVGSGLSAQYIFPWAMLPDVVEYDEKETGERREGIYYGLWSMATKISGALGLFVSGWALTLFGYVPKVVQTGRALLGIRLFFGIVPAGVLILMLPLLIWFPITKLNHGRLVSQLEEEINQQPT